MILIAASLDGLDFGQFVICFDQWEVNMSSDTQFTALGPTQIGFQTHGARIKIGADIEGTEAGVIGRCEPGAGIYGEGTTGIRGVGKRTGVYAEGASVGVQGIGIGASIDGQRFPGKTGVGVLGQSKDDVGVLGQSDFLDGVMGTTRFHKMAGVFGANTLTDELQEGTVEFPERRASGYGVFGLCHLSHGAGVGGTNDGTDPRTGVGGPGVQGISVAGYGGEFRGGRAPIRLEPEGESGPPASGSHQIGELYSDMTGGLYYCVGGGVPGKWMRVKLEPM